ncbi:3-dehydroquinate synthase [Gillisia mitskevichiae]|uniref:3-dehydroquinate synthase n=1 Tax=Gillisia mitskevichiae TaxID=270921 RepID=A0A495PRM1_9FLAO|nr:3-dehydroquinate synthase [Gillisia mitskevichiae]RKS53231.1 3-dehydroquinate synthase [Gillisia mitskevichiae]
MAVLASQAPIFYKEKGYTEFSNYLNSSKPSIIFVLVDSNTHNNCLNIFLQKLETDVVIEVIEMEAGEEHKNIETCSGIWETLSELGADRKSLILNLGGGVVTDLGGFVASTFKRGISYINIPTSLLAMVDASVGGKCGVDLGNLKNQIGVINQPEMVLIDSNYLTTLPANEMRSGLAEILKHGLIANEAYWEKAINLEALTLEDLDDLIIESIEIKSKIVKEDPTEINIRKTLNYGHTLGHAIESYFLTNPTKTTLLHGEAIAAGMIMATHLSYMICGFPEKKLKDITKKLNELFPKINLLKEDYEIVLDLLKFDKKNSHGNINFVLLKDIGQAKLDVIVPNTKLIEAMNYYLKN